MPPAPSFRPPRLFESHGKDWSPWWRCSDSKCAEPVVHEACSKPEYAMHVLPVPALLAMDSLRPHQELLAQGLLKEWNPGMEGRVIFVSHQWLGHEHPDPAAEQFSTLKKLLKRLMEGKADNIESHWMQQVIFRNNVVIEAQRWKAALPFMYVWIDFACIPQPGYSGGGHAQGKTRPISLPEKMPMSRSSSISRASTSTSQSSSNSKAQLEPHGSDHRFCAKDSVGESLAKAQLEPHGSDHRFCAKDSVGESLAKAVSSIPAYVERCCLLLVLVPVCAHADRPEICNYASWRSRGWCRMELVAALLARHPIRVMICTGAAATPHLLFPADALLLPACDGEFTCCACGHNINGRPIACDKLKVTSVVKTMLEAKVRQLARVGHEVESRFLSCVRHRFLAGVNGDAGSPAGPEAGSEAVARLKQQLMWRDAEDGLKANKTGWSLLHYAVMADDVCAVRELLSKKSEAAAVNLPVVKGDPVLTILDGITPLMSAMIYARADIVKDLLSARADPSALTTGVTAGINALMVGASLGRKDSTQVWLQQMGDWDLEQQEEVAGQTAFQNAAAIRGSSAPMLSLLLRAGADASHVDGLGATVLHSLTSKDDADVEGLRLLLESLADVNCSQKPRSKRWRLLMKGARLAARMGSRRQIVQEVARWEGTTPLANAAVHGNVALVRELLKARADPLQRNHQGRTALQSARVAFGGEAPRVLEELLGEASAWADKGATGPTQKNNQRLPKCCR